MLNEFTSNPLAQMGYQYTQTKMQKFFSENKGYFGDYLFSQKIRSYFDVDNSYLISKTTAMFFPFKSRRLQFSNSSGVVSSLEENSITKKSNGYFITFGILIIKVNHGFPCLPLLRILKNLICTFPWYLSYALFCWVVSHRLWWTRALSRPGI